MANGFRMFLHCLAANLLALLRKEIANPPAGEHGGEYLDQDAVPVEARSGHARRRHFNGRREADPLGEGHVSTWRTRRIKVAARIQATAHRVRVFLSGSWPDLNHFRDLGRALAADSGVTVHGFLMREPVAGPEGGRGWPTRRKVKKCPASPSQRCQQSWSRSRARARRNVASLASSCRR